MISVILNVYKRPDMLEKQIEAIKNQSIPIDGKDINIWYNKSDALQFAPRDKTIKTHIANWNTKFWGRFTLPLLMDSEYIALFDDDVIPNEDWLQNCLDTIETDKTNGILGGTGVILLERGKYYPNKKFGWNATPSNDTEIVDLVGHCWFFRQEWTKYLWYEKPITWDNGEDIMFSYQAQKYGKIKTFVPPHPANDRKMWSCDPDVGYKVGNDENATWTQKKHYGERDMICQHCIDNGWKTII